MRGLDSIKLLQRIALALSQGERVAVDDAQEFVAAFEEYQDAVQHREKMTLDEALGLKPTPGETPWWELEKLSDRDELLWQIHTTYFPTLKVRPAATAIRDELTRYETTQWKKHRAFTSVPTLEGLRVALFKLLKLRVPLSFGTIRQVLSVANHSAVFVGQPPRHAVPTLRAPPLIEATHGAAAGIESETNPRPG